jgi:Cu+-exporting ATPase
MTTTTLKVEGMTCGACTSAVESGLQNLDGVGSVSVSLVMERAVVSHDASKISAQEIRDVVEDRGFDAEVLASDGAARSDAMEDEDEEGLLLGGEEERSGTTVTTIKVGGMTCGACTSAVEGAFKNVAGVKSFSISLLSERAVVEHDTEILSPEQVAERRNQ